MYNICTYPSTFKKGNMLNKYKYIYISSDPTLGFLLKSEVVVLGSLRQRG